MIKINNLLVFRKMVVKTELKGEKWNSVMKSPF